LAVSPSDNTLASVGANLVKHWGALRAGISLEHTRYFDDAFGRTTNIGNDVNVFASYLWKPNPGFQIRSSATLAMRADEALTVQRYSYGADRHRAAAVRAVVARRGVKASPFRLRG
jgi:hypothetical protein